MATGTRSGSEVALTDPIDPEALVQQLRALRERIPDYDQLRPHEARGMVRAASLDPDLVNLGINALDTDPQVAGGVGRTAAELRQETADADRWTSVEDELRALLKGVAAANLRRKHRIGTAVLQIYLIVTRLVKLPGHVHLLPYLDAMKRLMRARNKRAKPAATAKSEADQAE